MLPYLVVPLISARVPQISTRVSAHCQAILFSQLTSQYATSTCIHIGVKTSLFCHAHFNSCFKTVNNATGTNFVTGIRDPQQPSWVLRLLLVK